MSETALPALVAIRVAEEEIDISPLHRRALDVQKSSLSKAEKRRELQLLEATPGAIGDAYREWLAAAKEQRARWVKKTAIGIGVGVIVTGAGVVIAMKVPAARKVAGDLAAKLARRSAMPAELMRLVEGGTAHGLTIGARKGVRLLMTPELAAEVVRQGAWVR